MAQNVLRGFQRSSERFSDIFRIRFLTIIFRMAKKVLRSAENRSPSLRYPAIPRQAITGSGM